jgi:hypothetical protein
MLEKLSNKTAPCVITLVLTLAACTAQSTLEADATTPSYNTTYGTPFQSDALNNFRVGYELSSALSIRFTAAKNGSINSVRWYNIYSFDRPGYHGGTGGKIRVQIQSDDGSKLHAPSGNVLASATLNKPLQAGSFPVLQLDKTVSVAAGRLYHIVFTNPDPNPSVNYISVDLLWMNPEVPSNFKMRYDFQAMTYYDGYGWENYADIPIFDVYYTDGTSQGQGYMEVWVGNAKTISGNQQRVREIFTVSEQNRLVSKVSFRMRKVTGGSDLVVSLEDAKGLVIERGILAHTIIPKTYSWLTYTFSSPQLLSVGKTYRLEFSTTGSGKYETYPLSDGSISYEFTNSNLFTDGYAQFNNGSGWTGWDQWEQANRKDGDLQLYFTVSQ